MGEEAGTGEEESDQEAVDAKEDDVVDVQRIDVEGVQQLEPAADQAKKGGEGRETSVDCSEEAIEEEGDGDVEQRGEEVQRVAHFGVANGKRGGAKDGGEHIAGTGDAGLRNRRTHLDLRRRECGGGYAIAAEKFPSQRCATRLERVNDANATSRY